MTIDSFSLSSYISSNKLFWSLNFERNTVICHLMKLFLNSFHVQQPSKPMLITMKLVCNLFIKWFLFHWFKCETMTLIIFIIIMIFICNVKCKLFTVHCSVNTHAWFVRLCRVSIIFEYLMSMLNSTQSKRGRNLQNSTLKANKWHIHTQTYYTINKTRHSASNKTSMKRLITGWIYIFVSILFHGNIHDKLILLLPIQCQLSPCLTYNFDADRNNNNNKKT